VEQYSGGVDYPNQQIPGRQGDHCPSPLLSALRVAVGYGGSCRVDQQRMGQACVSQGAG
jgi:hypothetical protein